MPLTYPVTSPSGYHLDGTYVPPRFTVEQAEKALKEAKKDARIAKAQAKKRKRDQDRAKKARRAALATFHEIAASKDKFHTYQRLEAARELKKWGTKGDCS